MEDIKKKYDDLLNAVGKAAALGDLTSDADGLVSLKIDGAYVLNLQLLEDREAVLCFVEVLKADGMDREAVYGELLSGNLFGRDTNGGWFGLEPETATVVYHYQVGLAEVEGKPETFTAILESILSLCDAWSGRLAAEAAQPADRELYRMICTRLDEMKRELEDQMDKLRNVFRDQFRLYDTILAAHGPAAAADAIETIENLEKLTSPVRTRSKHGEVNLNHLETIESSRIPWTAEVKEDGTIVYRSTKAVPSERQQAMSRFFTPHEPGVALDRRVKDDVVILTIPPAAMNATFAQLAEDNVREAALVRNT